MKSLVFDHHSRLGTFGLDLECGCRYIRCVGSDRDLHSQSCKRASNYTAGEIEVLLGKSVV